MWDDHTLQQEVLTQFLTQTKRIVTHNGIETFEKVNNRDDAVSMFLNNGIEQNFSTHWFGFGETKIYCDNLYSLGDNYRLLYDGADKEVKGVVAPVPGYGDKGVFVPQEVVGVMEDANETAFDFVEEMISQEVQRRTPFPVNQSAFDEVLARGEKEELGRLTNGKDLVTITTDIVEVMASLLPSPVDPYLRDIVKKQALNYYGGKQDIAKTIEMIEQQTERYLSEK